MPLLHETTQRAAALALLRRTVGHWRGQDTVARLEREYTAAKESLARATA